MRFAKVERLVFEGLFVLIIAEVAVYDGERVVRIAGSETVAKASLCHQFQRAVVVVFGGIVAGIADEVFYLHKADIGANAVLVGQRHQGRHAVLAVGHPLIQAEDAVPVFGAIVAAEGFSFRQITVIGTLERLAEGIHIAGILFGAAGQFVHRHFDDAVVVACFH